MKLSELKPLDQVIEEHRQDPEFREEWDALAFSRKVANQVIAYRVEHGLTQRALAEQVGLKQPAIARLEIAETQPRLETLAKLSKATGLTFDLHVANGAVEIVQVAKAATTAAARGFAFVFDSTVLAALANARPLVEQLPASHAAGDRPADIVVEGEQSLTLLQLKSRRLPGARIFAMTQAHGSRDEIDDLLRIMPADTTVEPVEVGQAKER
ncbi:MULTISPECIES: helix-turn-helix transcriptional regulator [unclassified Frankia]|uniref:helix-turn-helix transcriptional regulator n=1 Tax=unclassified Frankia TaxID=2632575 RepID=UPI001EF4C4FC|nr:MULTISPECIES: helix-turn-helix transcriptional regulator [unclassified Frankia]